MTELALKTFSKVADSWKIRRFYLSGFQEEFIHHAWPRLWSKQFKIRTFEGAFIKLNTFRDRFNFKALRRFRVYYAPLNLYMSVLNWLMPERVGSKRKANRAYPVGGEYVVDVDLHLLWRPHQYYKGRNGVCGGCLSISKDTTLALLDKIAENYSDLHVVLSGKKGFHIHVLDFNVRDWTHYNERDPIKSHEVARFVYTRHIKSACGEFDDRHFTLSCDPMRVVTFPGSLNGETGLVCKYLGGPQSFERTRISDIIWRSRATTYIYNLGFERLTDHAHPELARAMTISAKTGGGEGG